MGLFEVVVISLVFSRLLAITDRIFIKYPVNTQFLLFVCSFVGIMALTGRHYFIQYVVLVLLFIPFGF